jgi:hypothetical protein
MFHFTLLFKINGTPELSVSGDQKIMKTSVMRLGIHSDIRDKTKYKLSNKFNIPVDINQVKDVRISNVLLPDYKNIIIDESNNYFIFSEDILLYSRKFEVIDLECKKTKVKIPIGIYNSIFDITRLLDVAVNSVSKALITFEYNKSINKYTLYSTLISKNDKALVGFHVFKSPLLELLGFDSVSDIKCIGQMNYQIQKSKNIVQGILPKVLKPGMNIVIACMLYDNNRYTEMHSITEIHDTYFLIDSKFAFSDHLISVHYGLIESISMPRLIYWPQNSVIFLRINGFNLVQLAGTNITYAFSLHKSSYQEQCVILKEPIDLQELSLELVDINGQLVDTGQDSIFIELILGF